MVSITPQQGSCPLPTQPNRDHPPSPGHHWLWQEPPGQHSGRGAGLTGAAEALLADPQQHGAAEVAVGRFLEVLQPPGMLPIILHVLQGRRVEGEGVTPLLLRLPAPSAHHFINFSSPKNPTVFLGVCSQQGHGLPLFPFSLSVPQSTPATASPWAHPAPTDPWHSPATERILMADKEVTPHLGPSHHHHHHHGVTKTQTSSSGARHECFAGAS